MKEFHSDQQVNTEPGIQMIDRVGEDGVAITQNRYTNRTGVHALHQYVSVQENHININ